MKNKALLESFKEFARLVVFAAIGSGLAAAGSAVNLLPKPWMVVGAAVGIASLGKAWDKFIHEDPSINANGIVPF